jgi:hypothetical protein
VLAPYRVRVEEPASGSDTIIRFKEIVLNPKIPDQAFTQTLRAGMLQEEASCE